MAEAGEGGSRKRKAADVPLDTTKAGRKVWLVKVPPSVARVWLAACERDSAQASTMQVDEDDGNEQPLGRVLVRLNAQGKQEPVLDLSGVAGAEGLPQEYRLALVPEALPSSILSTEADGTPCISGASARVEGMVERKFDLAVGGAVASGPGGALVDKHYAAFNRARTAQAAKKATVESLSLKETFRLGSTNQESMYKKGVTTLWTKRQAKKDGEVHKQTRLERPDLERELFRAFERQDLWNFSQLQKTLRQPAAWLKEVLAEMAVLNKRGPNKDLWELKRKFKGAKQQGAGTAGVKPEGGA